MYFFFDDLEAWLWPEILTEESVFDPDLARLWRFSKRILLGLHIMKGRVERIEDISAWNEEWNKR